MIKTDVAVIGAGTAGLGAYRAAKQAGKSAVIIEAGPGGTTCARVGCMPSKLLIAAAERAHSARHSELFGIKIGSVTVDAAMVFERVRRERDRFVESMLRSVERLDEADRLTGYASFIDDHTLRIVGAPGGEQRVRAETIVVATGSSPSVPAPFRDLGDRLLLSDDIFELEALPDSLVVFGPGVIGLELGQALARLGVRLRTFGIGGLVGPLSDPDVLAYARRTFKEELRLDADAKVKSTRRVGDKVHVVFEQDGQTLEEVFDNALIATGRAPNLQRLNLSATSLELDERGVPKFDSGTLRCGSSNIFMAGDVTNERPLLHEAVDEGRIAGTNAAHFPALTAPPRRSPLGIVFSDPQIAVVGPGYRSLMSTLGACDCLATGEVSFEDQGRSKVMGRNKGLLRVYAENGSGRFLGAEMIGPDAEHIAHLLAWAHQAKLSVPQMLEMPFYHPVVEEGLRTALRELNAALKLGPEMRDRCLECGPGA